MKKNIIYFLTRIILPGLIALLVLSAGFTLLNRNKRNDSGKRNRHEILLKEIHRDAPAMAMDRNAEEPAADEPGMAAFHEFLMTFDPATGKVPRERLFNAMAATRSLSASQSSGITWQGYPSNMGGRTRMIMYDPNDPTLKKVWAGGVTGGLWYNSDITDAYSPWVPVGEFWNTLAIRCMAYDPQHPQTFFVGTGEVETAMQTYRESSGLGYGIGRSDDGGQTWQHIPGTENFAYVTDIVVRVESGVSVIYAGVASGLYKGSQHLSSPSDGLFRSVNGGASWQQVLPVITGSSVPYCVSDIALGADNRIYVGTRPNLDGEGGAVLLYSDDGINWTVNRQYQNEILANSNYPVPGRVVLAAAPSDPNVVYALIASGAVNSANGFNYFYCFHILRSANKGVTWVKKSLPSDITSGSNFATIAWHALDVAVDPNNANRLYVGGLDVHVSGNGGTSWTRVSDWALMYYGGGDQYIHADQHVILYKPGSSSEVLFGSDGGVFYTSQGTASAPVMEEHNENFSTLQFYTCAIHPQAGVSMFYGGLQDNGTLLCYGNPLSIFDMVSGGDGACCFIDQLDPSLAITSVYYNRYYVFVDGIYQNLIDQWQSGTFVNPADFDYNLKNLYCNAVDYGGNYQDQILRLEWLEGGTIGTFVPLNTGTTVLFTALKYSPYSPAGKSTLFVGTESGRLFRAAEAQTDTPVVTEIGSPEFPAASISCIALGKSEDTLMVTFSNYGVPSVWKSFNGGQTWQNIEGNLPDIPVRWALFHPQNDLQALIATETGIWECDNLVQTPVVWVPANYGMANVRVDMLQVRKSDNTVLAATHGRGFFTTTWDLITGRAEQVATGVSVFPNPSRGLITIQTGSPDHRVTSVSVATMEGKTVWRENLPSSPGNLIRQIDLGSLPAGSYLVSLETAGGKKIAKKILIY